MGFFHMSIAKNTSHMVAFREVRASVVVNLDVDNIVGPGFIDSVLKEYLPGGDQPRVLQKGIVSWRGHEGATTGRVAQSRQAWEYLNGYDEDCFGMGGQDLDLVFRGREGAKRGLLQPDGHVKTRGGEHCSTPRRWLPDRERAP